MGTATFTRIAEAPSMREAFKNLSDNAREEYGSDTYNGHINNTELVGDITTKYNAAKNKNEFIAETLQRLGKRDTLGIVLKEPKVVTAKIKSVVDIKPNKGVRTWETRYVVYDTRNENDGSVASEKTQGAAIKKARAYTEKTKRTTVIELEKVLVKGNTYIGRVSYKESKGESNGKYMFLVAAPE